MAKNTTPSNKQPTLSEMHLAIRQLNRRIVDIEAFDPIAVTAQRDPKIVELEAAIKETLSEVFGRNTSSYRTYMAAAVLDTAGLNLNGTPLHEVIEGLAHGKERSLSLLKRAVRSFQEKIEDDPDYHNARAGTAMAGAAMAGYGGVAADAGSPAPRAELGGAEAKASAGELRPRIQDGFPVGAASDVGPQPATYQLNAEPGRLNIQGNDADLILRRPSTTVIVMAVRTNQAALQLAALSLLASLDAKLEQLRAERSNSEDPAQYDDLKRRVEEFLAASSSDNDAPIVATTLSLADGLRSWWTKDHSSICNKALNISLFAGGSQSARRPACSARSAS
jgi:hypothetical protein